MMLFDLVCLSLPELKQVDEYILFESMSQNSKFVAKK
jgi:hypothetical protein